MGTPEAQGAKQARATSSGIEVSTSGSAEAAIVMAKSGRAKKNFMVTG